MRRLHFLRTYADELPIVILALCFLAAGCNEPPTEVATQPGPPWIVYTKSSSALVNNSVSAIAIDGEGNKWIGTDGGANRFNEGSWQVFTDELTYNGPVGVSAQVNAIGLGKDRTVWFGLAGGGVRMYNRFGQKYVWRSFTTPDLRSDMVYALAGDNFNNMWAGTSLGVSRYFPSATVPEEGIWLQYRAGNSLIPDEPVKSIGVNQNDNTIWFGTYSHGVVSYDGDINWDMSSPSNLPLPIISMTFNYHNVAWFGTYADWVYEYSVATTEWTRMGDSMKAGQLPDNFVNAVVVGNNVWFGTNKGLTKYDGKTWTTWTKDNSPLPDDVVKALAFDRKGNLWIGTTGGLAEFKEGGTIP